MAKLKAQTAALFLAKSKKTRPGIHSKNKNSQLKSSKLYKKLSRGQG